jgi:hypothetical protein
VRLNAVGMVLGAGGKAWELRHERGVERVGLRRWSSVAMGTRDCIFLIFAVKLSWLHRILQRRKIFMRSSIL